MRIRIVNAITTVPVLEYIKLHTHRVEINSDGFIEYFGNARPLVSYNLPWPATAGNQGVDPSNQDIYIDSDLGVGYIDNQFSGSNTNRIGILIPVPNNLDTSVAPRLILTWYTESSSGNVVWNIITAKSYTGFAVSGSSGITAATNSYKRESSQTVTANSTDTLITTEFELDFRFYTPSRAGASGYGDHVWIGIERAGADGADTHIGNAVVLSTYLYYAKWCEGNSLLLQV